MFYLFGVFLILTAVKLAFGEQDKNDQYEPNVVVRFMQRILPATHEYDGAKVTTIVDGKRYVTPMA